jgi:acetyltransferase
LSESHVLLRDGTPVLIRRLMAEDAVLYHDFLSDVTPEDLRLRFFASMHAVSENLIDKLLHYDPARAMAFIAVEEHTRRMLDVVRLHDDTSGANAEFAIMVRSRLKGLKNVRGQVLWQNTTMLAMCAELGFRIADDPGDCRFQKLDSCVPVMQSSQDCMGDDVPEAVDRAPVRRILSERNMRTPPIVISGEFRKDPPQVLFVEHNQMIGALASDRPDQTLNMAILPGRAE